MIIYRETVPCGKQITITNPFSQKNPPQNFEAEKVNRINPAFSACQRQGVDLRHRWFFCSSVTTRCDSHPQKVWVLPTFQSWQIASVIPCLEKNSRWWRNAEEVATNESARSPVIAEEYGVLEFVDELDNCWTNSWTAPLNPLRGLSFGDHRHSLESVIPRD